MDAAAELWPKIVKLTVKDFDNDRGHWGLKLGHTYRLMGDTMHARMFGDTAVVAFAKQLHDFPDRAQLRELLARALALGGRKRRRHPGRQRAQAARDVDRRDAPAVRALSGRAHPHPVRRVRTRARPDRAAHHDARERRHRRLPPDRPELRAAQGESAIREADRGETDDRALTRATGPGDKNSTQMPQT